MFATELFTSDQLQFIVTLLDLSQTTFAPSHPSPRSHVEPAGGECISSLVLSEIERAQLISAHPPLINYPKPARHRLWNPYLTAVIKQGAVFDRVIQEVCDSSQVDFEESGVDQKTLLDLRMVSGIYRVISLCLGEGRWNVMAMMPRRAGWESGESASWGESAAFISPPLYRPLLPAFSCAYLSTPPHLRASCFSCLYSPANSFVELAEKTLFARRRPFPLGSFSAILSYANPKPNPPPYCDRAI